MYVTGLIKLYLYLACHTEMKASDKPILSFANALEEGINAKLFFSMICFNMEIECPGGVEVTPGESSQNSAMASCSGVRLLTVS